MKAAASLAESTQRAPQYLRLEAENSAYRNTGRYDEIVRLYRELEKRSPYARLRDLGPTPEGRRMYVLVVSGEKRFEAASARRSGKPVVLLQNGIHAGENGGKDAAFMLLRDVLITKKYASWLQDMIILSIPVFNVDGHEHISPYQRINENGPAEMGFRVTANRLNLNRDYMKADTPEMRMWLALYREWLPEFTIDNHVTDGSDYQWDATIALHTEGDMAPPMGGWLKAQYVKPLFERMEKDGHLVGWYAGFGRGAGSAVPVSTFGPRYSTGYCAAQNRAALLVETHSLKSFRTRVWSHYDIMRHTLDLVAAQARPLAEAARESDAWAAGLKPGTPLFLEGRPEGEGVPYVLRQLESQRYNGAAAGGPVVRYLPKPVDTEVKLVRTLKPTLAPELPAGWLIPAAWKEVAERLAWHGVSMEPLQTGVEVEAEVVRFANVRFTPQPFEGRFQVTGFDAFPARLKEKVPAGTLWVPASQRAVRVAAHLLEPQAADSAVRWGFFHPIFEQKEYFSDYVFEPIAARMLETHPALKQEFEKKIASEPAFASNPRARLTWLFQRSPYMESDKDLYPVLRVPVKSW